MNVTNYIYFRVYSFFLSSCLARVCLEWTTKVFVFRIVSDVLSLLSLVLFCFVLSCLSFFHSRVIILTEVATEKAQQAVFKGVECFDPANLKHAETQEKIVLPDKEGIASYTCLFKQ